MNEVCNGCGKVATAGYYFQSKEGNEIYHYQCGPKKESAPTGVKCPFDGSECIPSKECAPHRNYPTKCVYGESLTSISTDCPYCDIKTGRFCDKHSSRKSKASPPVEEPLNETIIPLPTVTMYGGTMGNVEWVPGDGVTITYGDDNMEDYSKMKKPELIEQCKVMDILIRSLRETIDRTTQTSCSLEADKKRHIADMETYKKELDRESEASEVMENTYREVIREIIYIMKED